MKKALSSLGAFVRDTLLELSVIRKELFGKRSTLLILDESCECEGEDPYTASILKEAK